MGKKLIFNNDNVKIHLIVQCRINSSRLKGKILKPILGKPILSHLIERCKYSKNVNKIIIATTENCEDKIIEDYCLKNNLNYYRGSENNVLQRYYETAKRFDSEIIVRLTSDCPLIDPYVIDKMIDYFIKNNLKFLQPKYSNNGFNGSTGGFPDGTNPQIFTFQILEETYNKATTLLEKEHVCPYMIKNFSNLEYEIPDINIYKNINFSLLHLSLDTQSDYEFITKIYQNLYHKNKKFTIYDVLKYLNDNLS
jgi:spore coat polysaccharide biosynthesis protein SpsF